MGRGQRSNAGDARSLLYGRRPQRGSGPSSAISTPTSIGGVLSDDEMLAKSDRFPLFEGRFPPEKKVRLLTKTPTLSAPPTNKEYSGAVGIRIDRTGKKKFIAWTNYGPAGRGESQGKIEYDGDDFNGAIAAVNRKLSQKQSVKARSVYSAGGGPYFLSREDVKVG